MKKMDVLRLAWNEIILDKKTMLLAFFLQIVLFCNIIIMLLFALEIDSVFDTYCRKYMSGVYSMTLYNVTEELMPELEADGFGEMELLYDEEEEVYFTEATIKSLLHLDMKMFKWKTKGIDINADVKEVIDILLFIKSLFVFIAFIGILLCVLSMGNFYRMKLEKRQEFTNMLFRLGMHKREIGTIYRTPFLIFNISAIAIAYVVSFPIMHYFNSLIQKRFSELSVLVEKSGWIGLGILVVSIVLLFVFLGKRWKKFCK